MALTAYKCADVPLINYSLTPDHVALDTVGDADILFMVRQLMVGKIFHCYVSYAFMQ